MNKKSHKIFIVAALLAAVPAACFLVLAGLGKANVARLDSVGNIFTKTEANMASKPIVGYRDTVAIEFNRPAKTSEIERNFKIDPQEKVSFSWSQDGRRLEIKPVLFFKPGESYVIETNFKEGILKKEERKYKFSFSAKDYPKIVTVIPGKENSSDIKIDSDIKVVFDKPTKGYNIDFSIAPFENFEWESDSQKKEFRIFSKDKLKYDTDYEMKIIAQVAIENVETPKEEIFGGNFKTEKQPFVPPPKNTSAIVSDEQVADQAARINEGKYIDINLSKQQLSIFEDGKRLGTYKVSSGKRGMSTPTGTFKILNKAGRAYSRKYNLYMPYWMAFTGVGHGIHELPEWKSGYKEGANHLGIPVSHGCVRLGIGPAKTVFNWSSVGTPVVIHY
jgi:lipoprotein-anchoring transpeptidase ErfK/SrfK